MPSKKSRFSQVIEEPPPILSTDEILGPLAFDQTVPVNPPSRAYLVALGFMTRARRAATAVEQEQVVCELEKLLEEVEKDGADREARQLGAH